MKVPQILAPAGSPAALEAALEAGADAIYFGLDEGFNARARASNFPLEQLPEIVRKIHFGGARAYLALNTLIFESELRAVIGILQGAAQAGVDALIVQDPAVCLLARQVCPEMELHASTQMTLSSPEGAQLAKGLGISRVVLPRELSLKEIQLFRERAPELEVEVFIAGALCVSWSGQCLSSEAWGGRSANRGQCAQACRHPYELVVDGQLRSESLPEYFLSPQDLGGFRAIRELVRLGVDCLKIEGRQKDEEYVFQAVATVRGWLETVLAGESQLPQRQQRLKEQVRDLSLAYSRGLSDGFFGGSDHQSLVQGQLPRHQGLRLGSVTRISGSRCWVRIEDPPAPEPTDRQFPLEGLEDLGQSLFSSSGVRPAALEPEAGMGVVFRGPVPADQDHEQGGPIFSVERQGQHWVLGFGRPGPDLARVAPGHSLWVTSSPHLRKLRSQRRCLRRWPIRLVVEGQLGSPLRLKAEWEHGCAQSQSLECLQSARGSGLEHAHLEDKLGAWGASPFQMVQLVATALDPGLFLSPRQLKQLRQDIQAQLEDQLSGLGRKPTFSVALPPADDKNPHSKSPPVLEVLCRTQEQLEAALEAGIEEITLDWMELVGLNAAAQQIRRQGRSLGLATVRVQKPGEECYDRRLAALQPDRLLVRHWGAVMHFARTTPEGLSLHGDFSLNVTNSWTARHLLGLGVHNLTVAHDLDQLQLGHLLEAVDPAHLTVTLHHHISTFHTEHCLYSQQLSQGRDFRTCGRPCEKHLLELQDRKGIRHPIVVDVGCRNTVFNGTAQSCPRLVPLLMEAGIGRLRLEFVRESREETLVVIRAYQDLLAETITPAQALRQIGAHELFGVSLGTMAVLS